MARRSGGFGRSGGGRRFGGGGRSSSGGGRRGGGRSSAGNRRSGGGRSSAKAQAPKGQIKNGKVVQYAVKNQRGETKYIGSTNNPRRRATEHRKTGKMRSGDRMEVQTRPTTRRKAESVEAARIGAHRRRTGSNPKNNRTNDGRFHKR